MNSSRFSSINPIKSFSNRKASPESITPRPKSVGRKKPIKRRSTSSILGTTRSSRRSEVVRKAVRVCQGSLNPPSVRLKGGPKFRKLGEEREHSADSLATATARSYVSRSGTDRRAASAAASIRGRGVVHAVPFWGSRSQRSIPRDGVVDSVVARGPGRKGCEGLAWRTCWR